MTEVDQVKNLRKQFDRAKLMAEVKVNRFRHPRFVKAHEYWTGVLSMAESAIYQVDQALFALGVKEREAHEHVQ